MKPHFKVGVMLAGLLVTPFVMASSISLVTKKPDVSSDPKYVYSYTCKGGSKGTFTLSAVNDKAAQKQAEIKARNVCEET